MIPTDLKNHSRFSWYYKTKIRNWLWSITRVNPIAWCGNPEGLGTALQFLQDDSRLSLIVQNSSKARVFLTNGLERAMKLKSDRFWKSGLWKKRKFWKPQKGWCTCLHWTILSTLRYQTNGKISTIGKHSVFCNIGTNTHAHIWTFRIEMMMMSNVHNPKQIGNDNTFIRYPKLDSFSQSLVGTKFVHDKEPSE